MSKIGKLPIELPDQVTAEVEGASIKVTGPKGALTRIIPNQVRLEIKDGSIRLSPKGKLAPAIYGTTRALVANMVLGVSTGWVKQLELVGTGYRAEVSGKSLILNVGYSHPVKIEAPEGIAFKVEKTLITVEGIDKEVVGTVAANVRGTRPPEPYKGKGIRLKDEVVRKKAGKAAKAVGAASAV